ncbi:MAG TPA: hypothetical protein VFC18_10930 [Burkholderiales bacterium]|nr:hypothetical protein [Burkholderiales bacterium]
MRKMLLTPAGMDRIVDLAAEKLDDGRRDRPEQLARLEADQVR